MTSLLPAMPVVVVVVVVVVRAGSEVEAVGQGPVESINLSPAGSVCRANKSRQDTTATIQRVMLAYCVPTRPGPKTVGRIDARKTRRRPASE